MGDNDPDRTRGLLTWKKCSLAAAVFVGGYLAYFFTEGVHGFLPELVHHVGLFLAAVVAVHFIYELLVKRDEQAALRREISDAVATTINSVMPSFEKWGFQGFQDHLDFRDIFDRLQPGDELLWLDTYAPSRGQVLSHVNAALARGARIRMLAIAPNSHTAKYRAREIQQAGFSEQTFLDDLASFIDALGVTVRQYAATEALELRLYHDLPCVPMYIHVRGGVPVRGFTSYFLRHASENFAHARWTFADNGMLKHFSEYFEAKWANSQPAPSDAHDGVTRATARSAGTDRLRG